MSDLTNVKFLVVDDNHELRAAVVSGLASVSSQEVLEAENGREALTILKNQKVDFIVSDIRMPVCDGGEFLDHVRVDLQAKIPFIFMSGFADLALWDAYHRGIDGWLGKPFRYADLLDYVDRLLVPLEERWQKPAAAVEQHLVFDYGDLVAKDYFGRGGLFIQNDDLEFAKDDLVHFKVSGQALTAVEGVGKIVWRRAGDNSGLPDGYGIEFISLTDACRGAVVAHLKKNLPIPYIPRSFA